MPNRECDPSRSFQTLRDTQALGSWSSLQKYMGRVSTVTLTSAQEGRGRLTWPHWWSESQVNEALAHSEGVPKSSRPDVEHCASCWAEHEFLH